MEIGRTVMDKLVKCTWFIIRMMLQNSMILEKLSLNDMLCSKITRRLERAGALAEYLCQRPAVYYILYL